MIVEHLRIHLYLMMTTAQLYLPFYVEVIWRQFTSELIKLRQLYIFVLDWISIFYFEKFKKIPQIPRLISDLLADFKFSSIMPALMAPFWGWFILDPQTSTNIDILLMRINRVWMQKTVQPTDSTDICFQILKWTFEKKLIPKRMKRVQAQVTFI